MSTTTIANPDEFMDAESFAELGEAAAANTVIDYMYRDGSNWKTGAQVIFAGRITRDEISMILNARYDDGWRSEEHTSELQSLMRISYAVFCLKKKKTKHKDISTDKTRHEYILSLQTVENRN